MHTNNQSLVATPSYQKMRELCDVALDTPNGIRIPFNLERYDTWELCKKDARRFQQLFSSFRARARNTVHNRGGKLDDFGEQRQSPYDKLACMKMERPNGIDVCILPAIAFEIAHEILDAKTGEPIEMLTAEMRRQAHYINLIFTQIEREQKDKTRSPTPLTIEQELDAFAINEEVFAEMYQLYKWKLKSTGLPYGETAASTDVLDTPSDSFGVGEDGEV